MLRKISMIVMVLLAVLLIVSCNENNNASGSVQKEIIVPVETKLISKQNVEETIGYTGVIESQNAVDLIAEVSGKIIKVNKKLGDYIACGDVIAVIDDRIPAANLKQAEAHCLAAENNLNIAKKNYKSDQELFENGDISKLAFDNSELNVKSAEANLLAAKAQFSLMKKNYDDTRITSPVPGNIARENVTLGTMVNIGTPVHRVVDLSNLKVKIGIPQNIIPRVRKGAAAEVTVSSINNAKCRGSISFISPQADENSGTFLVEVNLKNPGNMNIRAGMTADVNLFIQSPGNEVVVPLSSIVQRDNKPFVYKVEGNKAKLTQVVLGDNIGHSVIVKEGLKEQDKIVITGMKNLGVDTKIKIEKEY